MVGRKPKLDTKQREFVRCWWAALQQIPTRAEMCDMLGISKSTLMAVALGKHKHEAES